jgi:hypothetical protein
MDMPLNEKNDPEMPFPVVRVSPSQCRLIVEMEKMFDKEFGFEHHDVAVGNEALGPTRCPTKGRP